MQPYPSLASLALTLRTHSRSLLSGCAIAMLSAAPALAAAQGPSPADSADFDWRPLTLAEAILTWTPETGPG